ncbi:MAG TPA: zf-HC2 domain-containing protein [Thermoanaerobaculia bacterium]|nr:zf-HC2 domain-containing protein [Thermoanaerobaculia bacterium]
MADETQDLDRLFERLAREGGTQGDPEEHPSVDTLAAYHGNELSPEEDAGIQEHLASCRRCAEIVLDFASFLAEPASEPEVASLEMAAESRRLQERIKAESEPAYSRASWRHWPAIAAVLTLVVVGFYFVSQPDRSVTTLDAVGALRGGEVEVVPLSHDLVLLNNSGSSFEEYRVEFEEVSKNRVVQVSGLREDRPSEVLVRVPRRKLEPGKHVINLLGIRGDQEYHVGTYLVDFQGR